jgi:hypothetical protein
VHPSRRQSLLLANWTCVKWILIHYNFVNTHHEPTTLHFYCVSLTGFSVRGAPRQAGNGQFAIDLSTEPPLRKIHYVRGIVDTDEPVGRRHGELETKVARGELDVGCVGSRVDDVVTFHPVGTQRLPGVSSCLSTSKQAYDEAPSDKRLLLSKSDSNT